MKKININSDDMIKVWFSLPEADWHNNKSESIWCKVISGQVIVDNIPLFAYKISYGDSIKYILDEDSLPIFNSVVKKS
jgi:hypothetical protein